MIDVVVRPARARLVWARQTRRSRPGGRRACRRRWRKSKYLLRRSRGRSTTARRAASARSDEPATRNRRSYAREDRHFAPDHVGLDAPPGGFDFGQFRHGTKDRRLRAACPPRPPRRRRLYPRLRERQPCRSSALSQSQPFRALVAPGGFGRCRRRRASVGRVVACPRSHCPPRASRRQIRRRHLRRAVLPVVAWRRCAAARREALAAARIPRRGARRAGSRASRGAPTEIALVARQRNLAQEAATLWAVLDPTAERRSQVVASACRRRRPAATPFDTGGDDELKQRLTAASPTLNVPAAASAEAFLQINRLFAQQAGQEGRLQADPRARAAVSGEPRGAFRRRARRVQHGPGDAKIAAAAG